MLNLNVGLCQSDIPLRDLQARMPQKLLEAEHIPTVTKKLDGKGVSEDMRRAPRDLNTGAPSRLVDDLQKAAARQRLVGALGREQWVIRRASLA